MIRIREEHNFIRYTTFNFGTVSKMDKDSVVVILFRVKNIFERRKVYLRILTGISEISKGT